MPRGDGVPDGVPDGADQTTSLTGSRYVRVGATILPLWLLWLLAALLTVGIVTSVVLSVSRSESPHQEPIAVVPSSSELPSPDVSSVPSADGSPDINSVPSVDNGFPSVPDGSSTLEDASAVVEEFYQDISNEDFTAAWELGGRNIAGMSYSQWVAGFDTTEDVEVQTADTGDPEQVSVVIRATQTDGSVKVFEGTYTVSDGVIVNADIN